MIHNKDIIFLLKKISISILLVLCFTSSTLQATGEEQEVALELYPQWLSEENYTVQGNIGVEKDFKSDAWVEYYVKPSVTYAFDDNWGLHAGLGLYYTENKSSDNNFEARPYQGISYFYPLTEKWKLSGYFRAEERFQYNTNTRDEETTLRLRLRFRTNYIFNPLSTNYSWHRLLLGIEGFKSNNNVQDNPDIQDNYSYESRVSVGIERSFSKREKVRFELSWKYQVPPGDISTSSVNTVYFKIQYYPVWGESLRNKLFDRGIEE
ncbi:MAG: DUF2490 domain-containing protein [Sulfurovum sp.]|nr:DUF2490 domain-containing protein [Sulfurovum sp.]